MKQTAVEFLSESLLYLDNEFDMGFIDKNEYQLTRRRCIEQAKIIEKEQINQACYDGYYQEEPMDVRQYYDKTFKPKMG